MARALFNAEVQRILHQDAGDNGDDSGDDDDGVLYDGDGVLDADGAAPDADEDNDEGDEDVTGGVKSPARAWRPAESLALPALAPNGDPATQLLACLRHYVAHGPSASSSPVPQDQHPQAHSFLPFFFDYDIGVVEVYMINLHPPPRPPLFCRVRFYRETDDGPGGDRTLEFLERRPAETPQESGSIPYPSDLRRLDAEGDPDSGEYISEALMLLEEQSGKRRPAAKRP